MASDKVVVSRHPTKSVICETGEFLVRRALSPDLGQVLLKIPLSQRPSASTIFQLEREYETARELDPAFVVRPLKIERSSGSIALLLEDFSCRALSSDLTAPLSLPEFFDIAIGVTTALAAIHRRNIVHKDIKPENIFLNRSPDGAVKVKLTGFGLASRLSRERQAGGRPEVITGTLAYMAPEQTGRMNRSVDFRSDLYALGVTFYQMLTGRLPFSASDPMEWVHCHIALRPPAPNQVVEAIPGLVSDLVMKLMAKTAEDRYQTADGVNADLGHCAAEWRAHGRIEPFALGTRDVADRLLIPEKLYGREQDIETLRAAYGRVMVEGKPEFLLVSGYSGIGKSAVVNELHKAIAPTKGLFASGKFDQYKRDIPYATLAQALQALVRQVLGKSEEEIAEWREAMREALGPHGQLITPLVPELGSLIGEPPPLPETTVQDAQHRFNIVFRHFIGVFARPDHPLALFVDDLQWLDTATLDLLEHLLTHPEVKHLLVIGAYRSNEIDPTHPLLRALDSMRKNGASIQAIFLGPLTKDDVVDLVADAFRCDRGQADSLAELVYEKTGGNPFFVTQFLMELSREELVAFDSRTARWRWDLEHIREKGYTDNIADLMIAKLNRLQAVTLDELM
jgi:serine/threonine protein kinase